MIIWCNLYHCQGHSPFGRRWSILAEMLQSKVGHMWYIKTWQQLEANVFWKDCWRLIFLHVAFDRNVSWAIQIYQYTRAVASSIIGGADIHIFVFTNHKNNWFQKKLIVQNLNIWISAPPQLSSWPQPCSTPQYTFNCTWPEMPDIINILPYP